MPNFVLLDDKTAQVAAILVHTAAQAFAEMAPTNGEQVADSSMKQA
jgi:hypothetical protein